MKHSTQIPIAPGAARQRRPQPERRCMMLEQAILVPIAVGALLWIMDMLLPEGRVARTAAAVAGVLAVQALLLRNRKAESEDAGWL